METWIIYVIAPIAIALVSWILGKNGRRIDETSKLVALLQEEITRLTAKVEKLEAKVEIKEHESERKSGIIQEAFRYSAAACLISTTPALSARMLLPPARWRNEMMSP